MNRDVARPICMFFLSVISATGQTQHISDSTERYSTEINGYLAGTECARTRSGDAIMMHPDEQVFLLEPNGDMAYISRNYHKAKLTAFYVDKWNLSEIARLEQRSVGECEILRITCVSDVKCRNAWQIRNGGLKPPSNWSGGTIYFADKRHATRAKTILQELTLAISENHIVPVASTDFPFPKVVLSRLLAEGGSQSDPAVEKVLEQLDDAIERNEKGPSKQYLSELTKSVLIRKGNRKVERFPDLYVEDGRTIVAVWAINNNLNNEWIMRGALSDVAEILKGIEKSGVSYSSVKLSGTFGLQDVYGNTTETEVLGMMISRQKVQRINWGNFRNENLFSIADKLYMHPNWKN